MHTFEHSAFSTSSFTWHLNFAKIADIVQFMHKQNHCRKDASANAYEETVKTAQDVQHTAG
jgi:hypothetical protein